MRRFIAFYIILLHVTLVVVIWKSDFLARVGRHFGVATQSPEISDYYRQILRYHTRSVEAVPDGSVIFIGDSITQGLAVAAVHPQSVNYGIASDTTKGVLQRLPSYMPALRRSKCIVLEIGINDFKYRSVEDAIENYTQILDMLPRDRNVIVSAILPVDPKARVELGDRVSWIERFNSKLQRLADERNWVAFVDSKKVLDTDGDGSLDPSFHDGDGVHLNSAGNLIWSSRLRVAIDEQE